MSSAESASQEVARKLDELIADSWFAFEGDIKIKKLEDPVIPEPARSGEGGVNCRECAKSDEDFAWTDDNWRLQVYRPTSIAGIVLLNSREHFDSFADMPPELLADLGHMIKRVEAACLSVGDVGRVHVTRVGDGAEHFHLWFMSRPLGAMQLRGSMLPVWMDVMPDLPEDVVTAVGEKIAAHLRGSS